MTDTSIRIPGPDHPIAIEPHPGRIVVTLDGTAIADSRAALTLREASYPPVQYIPRADVDMSRLTRSDHRTYCPFKGEAHYFSLPGAPNAVWTYEEPFEAVAVIRDHLAFYPDKVDSIEEQR